MSQHWQRDRLIGERRNHMKFIGPIILLLVIILAGSMLWWPTAVWPTGAVTILAVLLGIIITFVVEIREKKGEPE